MKWVFLAGLLILTPMLAMFLRNNRQHLPKAAFLLALLPFIEMRLNVTASPYTWPTWQGFVKGIDVSLIDSLAIAMIFAGKEVAAPLRLKLAFSFYVLVFLISTFAAEIYLPPLFYGWQLARVLLVYYAVARSTALDRNVPEYLLTGLIAGLSIQAVIVVQQKLSGQVQAGGWFGHQNLLGMALHFIVYPAFAALLGGYFPKRTALCVGAAFIVAWAGGSRATIGLMCAGLALTLLVSCWRRNTSRKMAIAGLGLLCTLVAVPILYSAVERRSAEVRAGSSEERERMRAAAAMIMTDHSLGVGANRFVAVANVGGYYARAGVTWTSVAALVHNTYYLVAAEMGVLGLLAFLGLLIAIFSLSLNNLKRAPPGFGSEYAVGTTAMVLAVAAHSYYEWITMYYVIHVLFAMNLGVMVALRASLTSKKVVPRLNRQEPFKRPPTFAATPNLQSLESNCRRNNVSN